MTTLYHTKTIVVGVDGSASSKEALPWALAEARLHGSSIQAIHSWTYPMSPGAFGVGAPIDCETVDAIREAVEGVAEQMLAEMQADAMDLEVHTTTVEGPAAYALIDAAEDAELLVVGSRGHRGFAGLPLGSVSQQCAHHARCPVAIVRAGDSVGAT